MFPGQFPWACHSGTRVVAQKGPTEIFRPRPRICRPRRVSRDALSATTRRQWPEMSATFPVHGEDKINVKNNDLSLAEREGPVGQLVEIGKPSNSAGRSLRARSNDVTECCNSPTNCSKHCRSDILTRSKGLPREREADSPGLELCGYPEWLLEQPRN
jgi:hypothetical protein